MSTAAPRLRIVSASGPSLSKISRAAWTICADRPTRGARTGVSLTASPSRDERPGDDPRSLVTRPRLTLPTRRRRKHQPPPSSVAGTRATRESSRHLAVHELADGLDESPARGRVAHHRLGRCVPTRLRREGRPSTPIHRTRAGSPACGGLRPIADLAPRGPGSREH